MEEQRFDAVTRALVSGTSRRTALKRVGALAVGALVGVRAQAGSAGHVPQTKDDCKNGGFRKYGFKNQGQCIKAVNQDNRQRDRAQTFVAKLAPLNRSGAYGTATVTVKGEQVTVAILASGLSPNLPHAQHIHIGGRNTCPPPTADKNGDGLINTVEGQPFYGAVRVSLTTTGDVSAASALAVDRFPVADAAGTISYSRTFQLPDGVTAADIAAGVIVQHGISELFADPNQYDGAPRSSLDPALPLEATIPADCGKLVRRRQRRQYGGRGRG